MPRTFSKPIRRKEKEVDGLSDSVDVRKDIVQVDGKDKVEEKVDEVPKEYSAEGEPLVGSNFRHSKTFGVDTIAGCSQVSNTFG